MPTWSGILAELLQSAPTNGGAPNFDLVRRKYLAQLAARTRRNLILYAARWTQPGINPPGVVTINEEDLEALMEAVHGCQGEALDLILHSPGGSPEAAEAIVTYLRARFKNIRVIVPHAAMSAATMLACASDLIVMGEHSFLGPIDPQIVIETPMGQQLVPADAVIAQFELAKEECKDPSKMAAWFPILPQYGPALLVQCQDALAMAESLVAEWLRRYMLRDKKKPTLEARKIARWLANHAHFKSHARHISKETLRQRGLKVLDLEADPVEQDLVLSVYHSTCHLFGATTVVKVIENHLGKAFMKFLNPPAPAIQAPASMPTAPQPIPIPQAPEVPRQQVKETGA